MAEQPPAETVVVTREVTEEVAAPSEKSTPTEEITTDEETTTDEEPASTEEDVPDEAVENTPERTDELLQVGETAADQGVQVTLLEAYRTYGDEYDREYLDEGEIYVVLDITYLNEGEATYYISTADWTGYNQDGYAAESSYLSALGNSVSFDGDLRPGVRRSGPVVFIASESEDLTAEFELYGVGYAVWNLGTVGALPEQSGASSSPLQEDPGASDPTGAEGADIQQFVSDYYAAVAQQDWAATYSLLDSETRAEFTEEQWYAAQEAREDAQGLPTINYVTVDEYSGDGESYEASVTRTYEDGTSDNLGIVLYVEAGELKRHLTEEELAILRHFQG